MDPNCVLARIRELVVASPDTSGDAVEQLADLQEAFDNLDEWLSKGGYLPADWQGRKPIMGVFEV